MPDKATPVSVYLDPSTLAKMKELARQEDRSMSWMISFAVRRYAEERLGGQVLLEPSAVARHKRGTQVDIEDQIVAAVRRGPVSKTTKRRATRRR